MTSTNYGKEVKSNQTSGPKGKTYYIELYKSLESKLNEAGSASERTSHLCEAWRRVHSLCLHSAPTTHPHLLSWLQRHTARTVLQTTWQTADRKDERSQLEESINVFIVESRALSKSRDGESPAWETQLVARGEWFKKILDHPWKHPVLNGLLNPDGTPPTDDEVLEWLKEERGVTFVMRLQTLVAEKKCDDIATILATAVMERVRKDIVPVSDADQSDEAKNKPEEAPSFGSRLKEEAGFTVDVWEMLVDIEFVLLHKRDSSRCIALAKLTPLRSAYQLIERLQSRLETSPREKRLWKSSKEVAVLIAQVVIARCMVVQQCTGGVRSALYCCARSLARLMASSRLPSAAAALAAPAPTAVHLHTLAAAIDAQLAQNNETGMKPFVCELYVRAITAGMNELERLKLKTEKDTEARLMEQTLASWFVQLGCVLARSDRVKCECALTAFSLHPSPQMYERIKSAPLLPPVHLDSIEQSSSEATNPQFGSWASDSRSQTNFVKTSETLNMKARQSQANVLSTAILNEGEALGLSTDICQDITVLLSGPRVKTLSWDMDRELLLENCRAYLERTHGGTKAVTTELKYLNLNPDDFQYLPEEDEDENNIYYGIEKGYEHLVEQEPEGIWENPYDDLEKTETANSSDEYDFIQPQRKKKTKKIVLNTDEDDPLSTVAENKRKEKKERPHSKERSRDRKKITELEKMEEKIPGDPLEKIPGDPLEINDSEDKKKDKPKRERKKKEKVPKPEGALSSLVGLKVGRAKKKTKNQLLLTDSDADSQDKVSTKYFNYEDNVQYDGQFSMDELKSSSSSHSDRVSYRQNEFSSANGRAGMGYKSPQAHFNMPYRPQSVSTIRVPSPSSYKSPSDHSRNNSPTFISNEVKTSITKLLEYRRLKSVEDRKKPSAIINPDDAHPMDKDISPKGVAIPEIPKSYINKQQSEHLAAELKQRVDDMIKYRKNSAIPSPVIQYASKHDTSPDKQYPSTSHYNASHYNIQKDRMTPSTSERCFSTPPSADKFMDSVNLVSIYDKDEPTHSRNPFTEKSLYPSVSRDRQLNAKTSDVNYQDYLHEYHKLNTYSHYAEKEEQKKVMRPISRVIPVVPKIKSDHKTPQSAKQMPQKPDGSLNTFSRLSYYKNTQTDKNKALDMSQQPQTVGSKLDGFIMNELRQSHNSTPRPLNDVQPMVKKLEKPTSARDQHPIMANILQGHSSQTQFQQKSVIPPKTILSDKDHNDLLLLLRQKNMLNKSQNSPNASSSKTVHNTQNSKAISSSTDAVYDTNPSHMNNMASPNLMTKNPNLMTSNLNLRSQPSLRTTNPTLVTSNPNLRTSNPSLTVSSPSLVASNPNMKTPNPNLTNPSLMASQLSLASSSLKPSNTSIRSSNPSLMGSSHSLTTSNPGLMASSPSLMTSNPVLATSKPSLMPSNSSYIPTNLLTPKSEIGKSNRGKKKAKDGKIINILSTSIIKPADQPHRDYKSKSSDSKKSAGKPKKVETKGQKKYEVKPHKDPEEWENVMDAICKQKTPCRGPNALDLALNKSSFEKAFEDSLRKPSPLFTSPKSSTQQDQIDDDDQFTQTTKTVHVSPSSGNIQSNKKIRSLVKSKKKDNSKTKKIIIEELRQSSIEPNAITALMLQNQIEITRKHSDIPEKTQKHIINPTNATHVETTKIVAQPSLIEINKNVLKQNNAETPKKDVKQIIVDTTKKEFAQVSVGFKKISENNKIKQSTYAGLNQDKHYMSTTRNSDYDLLDELMDDDLRKEIGELSSDEEEYAAAARGFVKGNKGMDKPVTISYNTSSKDMAMTSPASSLCKQNNMAQSYTQKPNEQPFNIKPALKMPTVPNQNKPGICLNAAQNVTTHVVTKPTQAHTLSVANDTLSTQITIERNMYVTAVPQTATNVMLIPSDLVYEGYSSIQTPIQTVTNIVPNVYVAVNTPGISMYQTTQCAVTVPVVNNIQCVTAIQSPVTNVTQSQYYYPNNDLLQLAHLATAQEKIVVNDNNLETNQCNIVNEHTVENIKQRTHENQISVDVNINKSGERKVLQEAQDKQAEEIKIPDDIHINKGGERKVLQQVQEKQADKTIDCKRRSQQFDVKDVKSQADKERLIKKRMAILNRKISHYCGVQPIALGYSPLRVVTVEKKELEIMDKKSSEEEYDHPSLQNNLQELINDVKSPATPDSYKENKSESVEVRRILLRSSNKLKNKTSSPATSPKPSIDRKMKALPAVALDTTTETSSEINQSNIETNDKPKRVSKRILNKFATTPKDTKRTEGSNMLTGKKVTPKMSKMKKLKYVSNTNANAATHEDFDTDQFFDIEAELLGSTIPKIIPSDLHKIDLPEISALEINIEEKELTPDYKDAESLPIEEEQLQQVTGLLVNTYTMIDNTDNPATDLNTINKSEDIINVNNENNSTFELKISKTEVTVKGEVMTKKDMIGNVEKQSTSQVVPESTKSNDSKTNNVGIPNPVSPGASLVSEIMNTLTLPSAQTPIKTTIDEKVQTLTAKENNNLDENNPEVGNDGDKSSVREIEKAHTSVSEIINCDENTSKVVNYNYNSDKTTCEIRKPQTIVSAIINFRENVSKAGHDSDKTGCEIEKAETVSEIRNFEENSSKVGHDIDKNICEIEKSQTIVSEIINFEENAFKVDHDSDKTGCEIEKAQTVSEITNFEENSSTVGHDIDKTICEIEKSQTTVSEIMNFKENAPKVCHDNTKHDDFQIKSTQKNTAINISSEIVSRPVCNTAAEDDDDDLQIIEDLSSSLNPSPAHKLKPPQNNLINDNFVIENIPNCYTGDPLKKVVRIKLGNGKTFKGTISGSENIDKLLCNPEIKSLLKSQLEQSKGLYSLKLNINKDLTNGDKILSTRIEHDVKTSHPRVPFETVSLLSDDEDEDKASPQVFDTEFGKHLINSLDRELFTKHQSKLKLKSYVKVKKLSLEEEYVIKRRSLRNMAKPNIRVQQNSKSLDDAVTIVDSPTSLMCSKIFDQAKILTAIPSKYVKGIFNDIENILAPANKQKAKEPVVLIDDSSNDSINDGQKPKPKEKINEFKNMLLKDLGVMDNAILATTESKDEVENTLAAESIDLTDDSVLEPTDKVNKQENYHDIINRNYFVKLVRCDEIVNNLKLRLVPTHSGIETTQIEEIDVPASRSRSGSFSILEDLPVVVDTQLNSNNERDNSSPVMEVYETIASLEGKFPAVRNTYKPPDDAIKCNSEWMITKNIERAQTLNSLTPALESRHTLVVPKLSTLTLTIIQDGDLVSKYVSRFRQPPSLKRKSKPSILPIAKVSKIDYISNEPLSNDCSQSSTITLHVSTTDAYIVAITEGKLQTESLDITPALSDTYVASITVSDINDDDVDRNNEELEKFKVSSIIEESTTCKDGVDIQSYYNDNDTVLVHADDQENREQDITLESPHSLTVFEEHLSSDITKYVSEETSRLQNDEIPNDDSKIEFYSVENHDISKKADSMHSAPPEKEYDNSTTIVTAISHNDDARALDNDDKSVMSIGDVKVRDGDHMDTNEIEALSKIASEESDGDVSCTAQNHLQDNNAKSIIVVHADDQENREQDITLESPHSLTVFEEHSSSDITKYVSEETSRLQNDEIPNDDSKIEFYSVENHDISKKADSMHSAPPEKEYDNSTTIVTAISHNDDARALDNDDKSVMSIGDVKVRGGDHMDTNEIEALSKIASEESDGDVSCTAQNHLQDNNAKSIIVVHADDQENREQDITLESPHSLTVFEEHSSSDITKYVSEETSRLQNDEIPNDDSKIEFYSVENHDISKKADSMHSAPPEKEYDNSTTIVTAISHNDDARALDNDDKSVMSIGDVKVRGGDHMDTNEIEALSKIASEESDGDVSCTAQNHLQDNNAKSIIELSSNTIEGFGMHIDGVEVSGNIEIETNQLEKSLSIVSEKFVGDISSTEFEHLNDRLDNAESIVALQENNIKDLSYTEQVVDNKSDSIAEEDNSALEVIDSTAAPDALNKTVESHNKIEELNKEETHEKCIGEVQSAIFTMSEKSCLATTIKILNTDTTIQKELLEETSCKTPNEEPQTSDKYVSQEKLHCEVQNTHNLKCVNILEKEIFINNINLAPETTKPLKRPFNELAENNTYKLETLSKSSSPISSPLQTTDEIIDALNKMFGESEGTAINEHSQGKLSSKANELNEYCFSKQNETSYSPIKTINKKKDLDSYKLSSENRSTQSGKDAPEIQETQSEREARIPKHRDEVFAALHKLFGEPDDVNSMDSSDVIINENEECIQDVDSQLKDDDDDEANNTTRENLCIPDSGSEILVEGDMLHKNIKDGITFTSTLVSNESEKEIKILEYNHDSVSSEENQNILDKIIQSTTKEVPEIDINGIVYEDTDIGTRYVISIIQEVSENNEQANPSLESNENIAINCDDEIIEDLKLNVPKFTYAYSSTVMHNMVRRSSRNMKRKKDMSDTKTSERKYRKGKNIDYPKITQSAIAELAYSKEYKRIIDYGNTIKFSYARPFHIDHIDVANMHKAWPIKECHAVDVKNAKDAKDLLYTDIEDTKNNTAITDPLQQTLNDEIVNGHKVNEYKSIDINETNFNMGFGERSGRVIQKLETGIEKLSAATLSDVKQYQPFSLSEASPETQNIAQELETQKVKFARFMNFINMKAKVQSVFKKTAFELNKEFFEQDKKMESKESKFPFDLTSSEFMEVPVETIVNVVQVGQLSVSANAQNSLTCDPRVTHVSDASPSQCSNNSPSEDSQATMETEYTELTTANITLPLVQEYANHHQSPPSQEQNSPGNDDDGNVSTLSIVKIELMEEEDTQENRENDIYENDFSPLPNNNVQYSFEDTSNTLFNTSAIADNTSTNTHNTSNNMFNASSNIDNSFTNIFSNSTNMDNTYTNIDNTPSTMESTYTNMDNGSTSMYSTSSNMGNSSTEMDNNDHMNEGSPDTNTTTTTNLDNNASADMDNSYTSIYNPITTDSNDMSNTTTNMCNTTSNLDESAIDLENRATNMNTSPNMENSAYDYTYESIEDYAANIENNNNPDNYSTNVDTYPQNVDNYSTTVSDYGSNIESYSSNGENYVNNTENYPTGVEHYSTNIDNYASDAENYATNIDNTITNVDNNIPNIDSSTAKLLEDTQPQDLSMGNSTEESKICNTFEDLSPDSETARRDQIAHAMTAAGIASESVITSGADELANLMSQSDQATANNYSKSTPINVMTLQQALSQVLPPPLNQTSPPERQMPSNPSGQQVLHIVQGSNAQTVINKPNGTHLLHIVQNKNNPNANGLSLVDAGLQQGGNQLIHIVNNGNQNNAQFLKRVNLLTNLTNAQGSNEQKMIQFVCKSADGKSIQLNTGHQRSMVLRLHPTNVQTPAKPTEPQDLSTSPTTSAASNPGNNQDSSQGIKSRSVYEENYAQFIQDSAPTPGSSTTSHEKATSLPKFNQVFGKQSYQENQNQIDHNGLQENPEPCQPEENNTHIEQSAEVNNPSLLVRNTTTETTPPTSNPTQPIKQTISPMNLHTTMHGGVIYTRQIPVNIGGGQTINLITVPSTELVDDPAQKQQTEGAFVNQEGEQSSIIKLVPHHASNNNTNVTPEENNVQAGPSSEANHTPQPQPQPQPVLTQMRIKLPMLSKGPHIVPGTRLVRPSFFQIQRNVIAGTNQPVYQQLVLTTAPSLGQSIRLPAQQPQSAQSPQAQPILVQAAQNTQASPHIPVQQVQHAPSSQHVHSAQQAHSAQQSHSTATTSQPQSVQSDHSKPDNEPDSELSTLTLEQLREFDMVLEQVKERSVQPTPSTTPSTPVLPKPAPADSTDGPALATTSVTESTQQVLYSVDNNQPSNVVSYVNRKSTITSATTSFVRSPDSSGIVDTPSSSSSSSQVQITHTVTSKSSTVDGNTAVLPHPKKKKKKKSSSSSSAMASLGSPSKSNSLKPQEDEQTTQRILYILAEYKEQVENSPDKNKPAPRRRNQFPLTTGSKRKRSHCSSRSMCRREGVDMSPMHEHGENGEDSLITLGSEDSSCGTTFSECTECQESHSPDQDSPTKVVRRLTFEQETTTTQITQTRTIPQRNVIVGDGQTITVARTTTATTAKPTTTVLMPANYLLPVSMIKGGQQIAIMTNRGPKILVGAGDTNAGALLFQRLIGPGLKPVLARPGVRHIRLPATALHNLQTFNIQTTPVTQVQPPDSTAPPAPTPAPPDLIDTRAMSSPWQDREAQEKPMRGPSPDCTEPWNMPSSSIADDYGYEEIVRTDNMERTVLDAIPDRYSPDMEAQRIFDKMFDVDSKKSMYDSPRCGYDIDTSDGDDKPYQQVVQQRKDGRHHRVTHVSTAALRHKYAILEHELRLQKSLSEECEDLGVDSPSASDLFPEADILFGAPSPAHEQTIDQCNTPPPIPIPQSIPQPDLDDQIATDHLLTHTETRNDDIDLNLDDVGEIVTVGEDGTATISTINAEEFARSHPNTTFHTEPEEGEITITQPPFTIAQGIKGRHITFHANRVPGTVVMAPQTTVISQAIVNSNDNSNTVKFTDIDNMINAMPCPQPVTTKPSVLVKDPGITSRPLSKFDTLKKDPSTSTTRSSSKYDSKFDSLKETSVSNPRSSSKYDAKFNNLKDSGGSTPRSLSKFDSLKESSVSTSRSSSKYDSKFDSLKEPSPSTPKPLSKFDSLLTESKLHLSNATARQVVHSTGHGAQVIRRLRHDDRPNPKTNSRFHFDEPRPKTSMSDEVKMRNDRALVESMGDNASSPGQPELFWDSSTPERQERRFHFSENDKATKSPFDELLNDSSAYGPHTRLDSVIKAARPERTYGRTSFEGISVSGSSEETRPLRTYPPKRAHTQHTQDMERHFTLKTTTTTHHHELGSTTKTTHHQEERSKKSMPRCQESEGRRRTGRGLVKRGCSCCTGSSAPPKKRSRPKKPSHTPTDCSSTPNS